MHFTFLLSFKFFCWNAFASVFKYLLNAKWNICMCFTLPLSTLLQFWTSYSEQSTVWMQKTLAPIQKKKQPVNQTTNQTTKKKPTTTNKKKEQQNIHALNHMINVWFVTDSYKFHLDIPCFNVFNYKVLSSLKTMTGFSPVQQDRILIYNIISMIC